MHAGTPDVIRLIMRLHEAAARFHDLLQEEAAQLQIWPQPDLWPLHDDKLCQSRELESCHQQLQALLSRQGIDTSTRAAFQAAVTDRLDAATAPLWQETITCLQDCQRLNAANGIILDRQQQATRQSLDLLRGSLDQAMTYGRQGARQHARRNLSLGQA